MKWTEVSVATGADERAIHQDVGFIAGRVRADVGGGNAPIRARPGGINRAPSENDNDDERDGGDQIRPGPGRWSRVTLVVDVDLAIVDLAIGDSLGLFRRSRSGGGRRCRCFRFGGRTDLHRLRFERAVGVFPIGARNFYVFGEVAHARSRTAFRDFGFLAHFEDTRFGFARDRERLRALIDRRDDAMKWNRSRRFSGGGGCGWRSGFLR